MELILTVRDAEVRGAAAGLTVEKLQSAAGVHSSTWNRWKNGTMSPTLEHWAPVCATIAKAEGKPFVFAKPLKARPPRAVKRRTRAKSRRS